MRFRRGRKSFGLIAVLSCVLTATVAFAAYTGYNYINGTTEVVGNPFKMVFANADGSDIVDSTISAEKSAQVQGGAEASDLTVSGDGTTIDSFTVTITEAAAVEEGGVVMYSFSLRNDGGAPAFLSGIACEGFSMPAAGDGSLTSGLMLLLALGDRSAAEPLGAVSLEDGAVSSVTTSAVPVLPGESVPVQLLVGARANGEARPVWEAVKADGTYGAEITISEITIEWSAVPPETSET